MIWSHHTQENWSIPIVFYRLNQSNGHLWEIDQVLYSCIVDPISVAGLDLNKDVLWASVFSLIIYNSSLILLILKGSTKGHHNDTAGGGTIVFSW